MNPGEDECEWSSWSTKGGWIVAIDQAPPADVFDLLDDRPGWLAYYADTFDVGLDVGLRAAITADDHEWIGVLFDDGVLDLIVHVGGEYMTAFSWPWTVWFMEAWSDELVRDYDSKQSGDKGRSKPKESPE